MSTRGIIAYVSSPGRWKGVWNHWNGHPQYLGQALIERIEAFDGDLDRFVGQFIERCPEGWSNFAEGERCDDPVGYLSGSVDGAGAMVDDGMGLDTHYLYLFDPADRSLAVYESSEVPVKSFGRVVFALTGEASPSSLPATEE